MAEASRTRHWPHTDRNSLVADRVPGRPRMTRKQKENCKVAPHAGPGWAR